MPDTPAMTFDVGELLDDDKIRNGPLAVFWNQDEWVPPSRPIDRGEPPRRKLRHRFLRLRPFSLDVRMVPPAEANLTTWGHWVAQTLGVPWEGEPEEGDKAVWVHGWVFARNAGGAIGSTKHVFDKLAGTLIGEAQVRVTRSE